MASVRLPASPHARLLVPLVIRPVRIRDNPFLDEAQAEERTAFSCPLFVICFGLEMEEYM